MSSDGLVTVSLRRSTTWSGGVTTSATTQHLGDQEGQLEALLVVEPRVADRLVAGGQRRVVDVLGAAEALGHVVAGQLDVQAARHGAQRVVHLEEATDLVDHVV